MQFFLIVHATPLHTRLVGYAKLPCDVLATCPESFLPVALSEHFFCNHVTLVREVVQKMDECMSLIVCV